MDKEIETAEPTSKQIYNLLIDPIVNTWEGVLKPSRSEEKWPELGWKDIWENFRKLQCVPPQVKERAWLMRHDMLPGLRARAFKHRNVVDPRDKMCPFILDGHQCDNEETLIHFYCECPGTQSVWNKFKEKILIYTDNVNRHPPVSDLQCLFCDIGSRNKKKRTAIWIGATFLSKFYEKKMAKSIIIFEGLWEETKEDFLIAKKCKGARYLDELAFNVSIDED